MKTIKFNNEVVVVPAETIIDYLEYRKLGKELEETYSAGLSQAQYDFTQSIMIWVDNEPKLDGATFTDVAPALEKLAVGLI